VQLLDWRLCGAAPGRLVSPTSVGRVSSVVSLDATRVSLFIDADHFRRCAVAGHERLTRQSASPSRVNIDGPAVSEWVDQAAVDLGLRAFRLLGVRKYAAFREIWRPPRGLP